MLSDLVWFVSSLEVELAYNLLRRYLTILTKNILALFDESRIYLFEFFNVENEELEHEGQHFSKVLKGIAEFVDEEGLDDLIVE